MNRARHTAYLSMQKIRRMQVGRSQAYKIKFGSASELRPRDFRHNTSAVISLESGARLPKRWPSLAIKKNELDEWLLAALCKSHWRYISCVIAFPKR